MPKDYTKQRIRTTKNKIRRIERFLKKSPNDPSNSKTLEILKKTI